MANNRMFLVHRPSGEAVLLAKRLAFGWHLMQSERLGERLMEFLDSHDTGDPKTQDDFVLMLEDNQYAPCCSTEFDYTGPNHFEMRPLAKRQRLIE